MPDVKTYRAPTMPAALTLVKRELGPDAVILGTRTIEGRGLGGVLGRTQVEITAAAPGAGHTPAPRRRAAVASTPAPAATAPVPPPLLPAASALRRWEPTSVDVRPVGPASLPADAGTEARPTGAPLPGALESGYVALVQNAVGAELARRLVLEAADATHRGARASDALASTVREFIARHVPAAVGVQLAAGTTRRVALVGPAGGGKTTTLAKLAAHFKLRQRASVVILSLDMHRLGTHAQLERYGEIVGVPVFAAQTVTEVKQALAQCGRPDLVLIDTPGVGVREAGRFARLAALLRAARPDETHLVMPAYATDAVARRIADNFAPLGFARVVLTHLDDAVGFGVVLNMLDNLHCAVSYVSGGQRVPNDLEEACGPRLAELICPPAVAHV